jgi:Holliday junction DNA helicase RuvA
MRLLTELRERAGAMPLGTAFAAIVPPPEVGVAADAVSALVNLGYRRAEAQAAVATALERLGDAAALDAAIREGLKELAR